MFSVVYRVIGAIEKPIICLIILILLMMPAVGSISEYSNQELNKTLITSPVSIPNTEVVDILQTEHI